MREIVMPRVGLTMEEGTITEWKIGVGDRFVEGDIIAEMTSDKAQNEIEAPFSGVLRQIVVNVDGTAAVGSPIARADEV